MTPNSPSENQADRANGADDVLLVDLFADLGSRYDIDSPAVYDGYYKLLERLTEDEIAALGLPSRGSSHRPEQLDVWETINGEAADAVEEHFEQLRGATT